MLDSVKEKILAIDGVDWNYYDFRNTTMTIRWQQAR